METGNRQRSPVSVPSDLSRSVLIVMSLFLGRTCFHIGTKHILVDIYLKTPARQIFGHFILKFQVCFVPSNVNSAATAAN